MIRLLLAAAGGALAVLLWACEGSGEPPSPTALLLPTLPPPSLLSPDPNVGCPPFTALYCADGYRPPPASCHVSPVWDTGNANLSTATGQPPVWVADVPVGGILSAELRPTPAGGGSTGAKTIWIVDDDVEGEVTLSGRRLDGPEVAVFPLYERDYTFEKGADGDYSRDWERTELVLIPPHGRRNEHRTEVDIPGPGCWQFTARTEKETVEIVLYLYPLDTP